MLSTEEKDVRVYVSENVTDIMSHATSLELLH